MNLSFVQIKNIIEGALLAAGQTLSLDRLFSLFTEEEQPSKDDMLKALHELQIDYTERGMELIEVSTGYRIQVRQEVGPWVARLWEEKPQRYSRALMETLAVIAYRQPITRGEIEDIRGVTVASNIIKTLQEREWIRIVGQRDIPGKPAIFATTRQFLDHFNLQSLEQLPTLAEIRDIESINAELDLSEGMQTAVSPEPAMEVESPAVAIPMAAQAEADEAPAMAGIEALDAEISQALAAASALTQGYKTTLDDDVVLAKQKSVDADSAAEQEAAADEQVTTDEQAAAHLTEAADEQASAGKQH